MAQKLDSAVLFFVTCLVSLAGTACAGGAAEGQDPADMAGEEGHADSNYTASSCERSRAALLAATSSSTRKAILQRALRWVDASVAYDQGKTYKAAGDTKAYRTDCSGFISMAWSLSSSINTTAFGQSSNAQKLSSIKALQPGDAVLHPKTSREPFAHIMLFAGWEDDAHEQMCAIQMMDTENDMVMSPYNAPLLAETYVPIKKPGL